MNRIIKFRAWDKQTPTMFYNVIASAGVVIVEYILDEEENELDPQYYTCNNNRIESPFIVMQFTGLYDKHGKEIYEDDIVKTEHGMGRVIFHMGCFMIEWVNDKEAMMELLAFEPDNYRYGRPRTDIQVIGNIHKNPELLAK